MIVVDIETARGTLRAVVQSTERVLVSRTDRHGTWHLKTVSIEGGLLCGLEGYATEADIAALSRALVDAGLV